MTRILSASLGLVALTILTAAGVRDTPGGVVRSAPGTVVSSPAFSGPLILDDANTVAHVTWNGTALVDSKGNTWAQNGTVPQVGKSGKTPPGAGPFSSSNYYSLGAGSDVADFAGDFSVCVVMRSPTTSGYSRVVSDGAAPGGGWFIQIRPGNNVVFQVPSTGECYPTATSIAYNTVSVTCGGAAGANVLHKSNLKPIQSTASCSRASGSGSSLKVGRGDNTDVYSDGVIYEVWISTTTPSDDLFTAIQQRVKTKLGTSEW